MVRWIDLAFAIGLVVGGGAVYAAQTLGAHSSGSLKVVDDPIGALLEQLPQEEAPSVIHVDTWPICPRRSILRAREDPPSPLDSLANWPEEGHYRTDLRTKCI